MVRRAVQGLEEACGEEVAGRLALIYSELVTNAIRHSGIRPSDRLDVTVEVGEDRIWGSVVDPGCGFDPDDLPERGANDEGGFGLRIVDAMSSRWGVKRDGRSEVWFELGGR
jgi:signal transduction histidine kinase